ncbi:MAG: hypothetical protein ACM31E_08675 [Fibrobacterota bacterium]|nr:hypothetical protein [Chitinispirillaceae bacterium]
MKSIDRKIVGIVIAISTICSVAEEMVDEDALFSDTNMTVDSASLVDNKEIIGDDQKTTVGFSGTVNSVAEATFSRTFFDSLKRKEIQPSAYIVNNLMLDVRMAKDVKAFSNLELTFRPDSSLFDIKLQELFLDFNFKRIVYFRTGKQVLQWGRCYFWNPTDLINIEKKTVEPQIGYREGAYGVKMHIPFGTKYNIYGFTDMKQCTSVDSLAGAIKGEMVIGTTEIGAAVWGKHNRKPVFGIDFSTRLLDFDITGEMSLESGDNVSVIKGLHKNEPMLEFMKRAALGDEEIDLNANADKKVVPKMCVGVSRSFDLLEVKDRVTVITEFFLNQAGVEGDFYDEHDVKALFDALAKDTSGRLGGQLNSLRTRFSKPNEFSRYYVSLFTTVNKFIIPEMSLQLNSIINFEQSAALLIGSLQYTTLHNLFAGLTLSGAIGGPETEYTMYGNALSTRLNIGINF